MEMMKAFIRDDAVGDAVSLTDVPVPEPGEGQVLVKVHAIGVGVHDRYFLPPDGPFPYVIGIEASGTIVEMGTGVEALGPDARVLFSNAMNPKGGTWAEFTVVNAASVIPMPDELDFAVAAGFPVAGGTAIEGLHTLDLKEGETLFVAGASGAIGTLVVQMAAARGIRVAGSASPRNHDYLLSLGAEKAVDYNDPEWQQQIREWASGGADGVLAIQPGTGLQSEPAVREGGHLVTVSGDPFEPERDIRVEQFRHRPDSGQDRIDLLKEIAEGRIHLVLEKIYPFEEAVAALEKTETRHARGKLIVAGPGFPTA